MKQLDITVEDEFDIKEKLRAELADELKRQRSAAERNSKLASAHWNRHFRARVEAGLVDADKFSKYMKIMREQKANAVPEKPEVPDSEVQRIKHQRFRNPPLWAHPQLTNAPLIWQSDTPYYSDGAPKPEPNQGLPIGTDDAGCIAIGNVVRLYTSAMGDYPVLLPSGDYNVPHKCSTAHAYLYFKIPADALPPFGGSVRVFTEWTITGEYRTTFDPWFFDISTVMPFKTELELKVGLSVTDPFDPTQQIVPDPPPEPLKPESVVFADADPFDYKDGGITHSKEQTEVYLDVPGGTPVDVRASLHAACIADGHNVYPNLARIDLGSQGSYSAFVTLKCQILDCWWAKMNWPETVAHGKAAWPKPR